MDVVKFSLFDGSGEEFGLVTKEINDGVSSKYVIFIPFAPTPTSGRLVIVNKNKVRNLETNAAEVFSSLISMGKNQKLKDIYLNKSK